MKKYLTHIYDTPIYEYNLGLLPYNPHLKSRARSLRKAGVLSEVIFWKQVHQKKFHQIDFDRQQIIGNYIVDFYIRRLSLVVEIDGTSHNHKEKYDAKREDFLKNLSLEIYRISDLRVKHDLDNVMRELEDFLIEKYGGG